MMQKRQKLFVFVGNYSTNSNMQPIYIYMLSGGLSWLQMLYYIYVFM